MQGTVESSPPAPALEREAARARRLWPAVAALVIGVAVSAYALIEVLRHANALRWYHGTVGFPLIVVALAVSVLIQALAAHRVGRGVRAFSWRLLFYVILLHFVVVHAALQPFRWQIFCESLALAGGAFGIMLLAGPRLRMMIPASVIRMGDIVLMNVGIIIVMVELGLRLVGLLLAPPILAQGTERAEDRIDRYRYPQGTLRYGFPVNERGFYDEELTPRTADDRMLVASIGDSFAAGVVPHWFHYTTVAERELGVRVHNIGVPAIGLEEYRYLMRYEALPVDPDVVLINLFVGNDIRSGRPAIASYRLLRSWYDRKNLLLFLLPKRLAAVLRERARMRTQGNRDGVLAGERGDVVLRDPEEIIAAFPWVEDPARELPFLSDEGLRDAERRAVVDGWLAGDDPYRELFAVFEEMLLEVGDARLAVMLIPARCQLDDELWAAVVRRGEELDGRRDYPQQTLISWFEARGVPVLDLLPPLRSAPPLADGKRHLYHRNDTHFNARGNRIAGEALAGFLATLEPSEDSDDDDDIDDDDDDDDDDD